MRRKLHRDKSRRNIYVRSALAVTAAAVVLILLHAITVSSWDSLASAMEASKFGFALWRLSLFLLLIGGWPVFTDKYADWVGLTAEETASLKAYHWRMAVWLLVMEALFCQTLWLGFARTLAEIGSNTT
ncbi:hypothetical protein [Methylomonas methanica]|uniref:Uncharacterized protein n=1 Tax=Methylomonas methanica (strain DSM 25384 / MC09) TaxID=857087 RepID=G0A5Z3_METMM|nr:hypothetical protein [Methylomonas methanica]AEG00443.1 hypothetical protein Metme_2035 [Methylomonas methanica MC09]